MSQALDLKLVMPFGAPFPFDAFALPKLRHLSVETVQGLPVALREAPILPSMPLQTLQTLNFAFQQSFTVLVSENGVPLLEAICPNLRHLILLKSANYLTEKQAASLPRRLQNLETLDLRTGSLAINRGPSLSYLHLVDLPASLKNLEIISVKWKAEEGEEAYARLRWPPGLETFRLGFLNRASTLHYFPPCATSIYVDVADHSEVPMTTFETSKLPKTLKRLAVFVPGFFLKPDGIYPPELVSVSTMQLLYTGIHSFDGLPRTLEQFPDVGPFLAEDRVAEYFPRLKYLYLHRDMSFMPKLPPFLHQLDCDTNLPPNFVSALPASLANLSLNEQSISDLVGLKDATPNLESLRIKYDRLNGILNLKAVNWFPQRLSILQMSMNLFESKESIAALPQSLTFISLSVNEGSSDAIDDPDIFLHFPPQLKRICLYLNRPCPWRQWISSMEDRYHNLEDIEVSDCEQETSGDSLGFAFLKRLPISLTKLALFTSGNLNMDLDCLKGLPKGMGSLVLQTAHSRCAIFASDENFSALPRKLYYLNLWNISGLSAAVLPLLPPSITNLTLPIDSSEYYIKLHPNIWRGDS
jgi:hypothetical protein